MAKRNLNNMGSVRKRHDGRYEGRYTAPDGKQRSIYAPTAAACTAALRAIQNEIDVGKYIGRSNITVSEWFSIWLSDYQQHTTARTRQVYAELAKIHILPVIGHYQLTELSPMHIRRVISVMTSKCLSANYIHSAIGVISVALNAAIEAGIIKVNPAKGIKTPPRAKTKFNIIDRTLILDFIKAAQKDVNGNALIFALFTGLRASELRALQWSAVNLDKSTIDVCRQLTTHSPLEFVPPKDNSARVIAITPQALAILKQQKKRLAELQLAAGEKWEDSDIVNNLVFRSAKGHFLAESVMQKACRRIGAEIGIPNLHPHDLRHSYAVAALRSGIDVKTLQHNLGHKNAAITLDVYAAYTTDAGIVGAEKLAAYFPEIPN